MTVTYDATLHDIGINGVGYMRYRPPDSPPINVSEQDAVPSTDRSASGKGKYDTYQVTSFHAEDDWGGGAGQETVIATDAYLQGPCLSHIGSMLGPTKKRIQESDGGLTSYFFRRGTTLYGLTAGFIETIGSAGSQARTAGAINCLPVQSLSQNEFWVRGNSAIDRWTGSGATSDVVPSGFTPYVVVPYGSKLWALGTRVYESSGTLVQSKGRDTPGTSDVTNLRVTFASPPSTQSYIMAAIYQDARDSWAPDDSASWELLDDMDDATVGRRVQVYGRRVTSTKGFTSFNFSGPAAQPYIFLMEWQGVDLQATLLDSIGSADSTADNSVGSGVLSSNTYGVVVSFSSHSLGSASGPSGGFVEILDNAYAGGRAVAHWHADTAATAVTYTPSINADDVTLIIGLSPNAITSDVTQMAIINSDDDGASWNEVFISNSAMLPLPIAAVATQGRLWWTTDQGLYCMRATEEYNPATGEQIIDAAIQGPVDHWSIPYDTANVGTWICCFNGLLYYNVGATLHRFTPSDNGGVGEVIWPSHDWATVSGAVKCVIAGENGIYFSSAGYLWFYDELGFHDLIAEGTAGEFDVLYWHAGRLYTKGDPAYYYDFKYPSARPDSVYTAPTTYAAGNYISSAWDGDKVDSVKVIRKFILEAKWTASSDSGTITAEYLVDDGTNGDPGRYGGTASALTWTSIGSMTVSDGRVKVFTLATPIECYRVYLRLTITPGTTNGIPLVKGWAWHGDAIMPPIMRFVATLGIGTNVVNLKGDRLYNSVTEVKQAVDAIRALRRAASSPRYFTLSVKDEIGGDEPYVVIPEQLTTETIGEQGTEGFMVIQTFAMRELPK